jgi:hypothetical protein
MGGMAGPDGGRYARVIYAQREDRRMPYRYPRLLYFVMSIVTAPRVMTVSKTGVVPLMAVGGRRWAGPPRGARRAAPPARSGPAVGTRGPVRSAGCVLRTGLAGVEPKEVCGTRAAGVLPGSGVVLVAVSTTTLVRCA